MLLTDNIQKFAEIFNSWHKLVLICYDNIYQ
jgi:hypothetical protein